MAKQARFGGVEISKVPEVVTAAKLYCEARDDVTASKVQLEDAKSMLIGAMNDVPIQNYERDGFVIHLTPGTPSIDVKRAKGA